MNKKFYLVRHGAPAIQGVLLGQKDVPLSDVGRRQAREIAQRLEPHGIERIVSSRLSRAMETAQPIAEMAGLPVEFDERLNEITYGVWDGLTWEQIVQQDPAMADQKQRDWWAVTPSGGEAAREFLDRVRGAFESLLAHPAARTVIVAHQGVNAVLSELIHAAHGNDSAKTGVNWARISAFEQPPGTFHEFDLTG